MKIFVEYKNKNSKIFFEYTDEYLITRVYKKGKLVKNEKINFFQISPKKEVDMKILKLSKKIEELKKQMEKEVKIG